MTFFLKKKNVGLSEKENENLDGLTVWGWTSVKKR